MKKNINIFVDLDGVLADFDRRVQEICGKPCKELSNKEMWPRLSPLIKRGVFWQSLPKIEDADLLWNSILELTGRKPTVLSACGTNSPDLSREAKTNWVVEHFGAENVIVVIKASQKAEYASSDSILIDDSEKAVNPWIEAGGIGILHKSAVQSILELKEIL